MQTQEREQAWRKKQARKQSSTKHPLKR
jgi:hypothetical protein